MAGAGSSDLNLLAMQCSLVLAVLVAAFAVAHAKIDHVQNELLFNECKEETGATENYKDIAEDEKIPTSDKGMCLMECVLRKKGVYDSDSKYSPEGSKKHFEKIFAEKPETLTKILKIVEECSKINVEGMDKCEAAVKHISCVKIKSKQENISMKD